MAYNSNLNRRLLGSNTSKDHTRYNKNLYVYICLRKPLTTTRNKDNLELFDVLEWWVNALKDADAPYLILADYIRQNTLKYETFL